MPDEVHEAFLSLARGYRTSPAHVGKMVLDWRGCSPASIWERDQYIWQLRTECRWSLDAIGNACGLTRERVRQLVYQINKTGVQLAFTTQYFPLPIAEPDVRVIVKKQPKQVEPQVLKRLKELHAVASKVRGKSPKYRAEAEELARLLNQQVLEGVSIYSLAKALGLTHGAVNFRLVRYGYRKTAGKSRTWQPIMYSTSKPYKHRRGAPTRQRVWTVWVQGVEVSDRLLSKNEADTLANEWTSCGYGQVELYMFVKDTAASSTTGMPKGVTAK